MPKVSLRSFDLKLLALLFMLIDHIGAYFPAAPEWFRWLGQLRKGRASLRRGTLSWLAAQGPLLAYLREVPGEATATLVNAGPEEQTVTLPGGGFQDLRTGESIPGEVASVLPYSVRLLGQG